MLRSSALVSFLSLIVSMVSFANQVIIAKLFGATIHLDAYLVAIGIPYLVKGVITGLFAYSLVPIQVQHRTNPAVHYARFSGLLLLFFLVFAILVSLVGYVFSPFLVQVLTPALSDPLRTKVIFMARVSWITVGCTMVVGYLGSMQNAAKQFVGPVLASLLPYLGMIVSSSLWAHELGVTALVWGMLAGYLIAIPLVYIGVARDIVIELDCLALWREAMNALGQMPLVLLSMLCFTMYGTVDAFWASRLGPGNLSYLGYSQRILVALGNGVILGPATVMLPYLAEAVNLGESKRFRRYIKQAERMILVVSAPAALMVSLLSVPIVELLFQRGAFDRVATLGMASVLPGMLLGMVAMTEVVMLFKAFYAKGEVLHAVVIGSLGVVSYFVLSGVLSQFVGLQGIVIAYASTWWLLFGVSLVSLWQGQWRNFLSQDNLTLIWQLFVAMMVCGGLVLVGKYFLIRPVSEVGMIGLAVRLAVTAGMGTAGYVGITAGLFRMPEMTVFRALMSGTRPKILSIR